MAACNNTSNETTTPGKLELLKVVERRRREVASVMTVLEDRLFHGITDLLTEERRAIVALTPLILLQKLRLGELTATVVLEAFQAKALLETRRTNCITEFILGAEEWAAALDAQGDRTLPLFGLPISVKDNINVQGMDSTLGLAKFLAHPVPSNAALVQAFKTLGAVPFCKTNVPQILLSFGCSNPIWGVTQHPSRCDRTPGGSSGGESALIAGGGSVLGLGTDVGGSVRTPTSFCGGASIKPTFGRISNLGIRSALRGMQGVYSTPGLMGRDVDIVVTCLRALLQKDTVMFQLDPLIPPLPWRQDLYDDPRPLRVGWYDYDGFVPCTPGSRRAVTEARAALQAAGHTLVPFTPLDIPRAWKIATDLFLADQGQSMADLCENEVVDFSLATSNVLKIVPEIVNISNSLANTSNSLANIKPSPLLTDTFNSDSASSYVLWQKLTEREEYVKQFLEVWLTSNLDVVVCPAFPIPAPHTQYPPKLLPATIYPLLYNLLNFPAGVVAITHENEEDQRLLEDYPAGDDPVLKDLKNAARGATGLPLGVQVVGLPWQEETLCRAMKILQEVIRA